MDPTSIVGELQRLNDDRVTHKPAAREQMLVAAQKLVASLQVPGELISSMSWTEPAKFACIRTAIDLKIFDTLTQHGNKGVNAAGLAKPTGADVSLISRIMRHLVATWFFEELAPDLYRHTEVSKQFVESRYSDGVVVMFDGCLPPVQKLPSYFINNSWKDPTESDNGPFQYALNTKSTWWQWIAENPPYLAAFGNYMAGYRAGKVPWYAAELFPVQEKVIDALEGEIALVDVGGGQGHDLLGLLSAFPTLANKVVLQDRPPVIADIKPPLPSSIKSKAHDFFTPQPVQNARAYFMHSILHDWDDENCIRILQALKPAMKPGYSKILINDLVIADEGASCYATSMDLLMCSILGSRERTESDFRRLLTAAGLQLDRIWIYEPGTEAIIEASLPM